MRILLTADQYFPPTLGGSAVSSRRLAHGLAGRGHRVTVLAPSPNFSDFVEREGEVEVVRCRSLPVHSLLARADSERVRVALLPMPTVKQTLLRTCPDVIHVQMPAYIGLVALTLARRSRVLAVGTLHALPRNLVPGGSHRSPAFRLVSAAFWRTIADQGRRCAAVTAPSWTACRMLAEHGLPGARVISNGVDLERFRPPLDQRERAGARERLGLPVDKPLVLYAGRFSPEKRLDVLLQALPLVLEHVPAHLVLVGAGRGKVQGLVHRLGLEAHVSFAGLLPDDLLPLTYRAADVFALPSEAELQGMVLLEAAASGLPLVGADAHAIPELVRHGQNGFLHRPGDPEDLAARLVALLADPTLRAVFSRESRAVAREHAFERTLDSFEALFEALRRGRRAEAARERPDGTRRIAGI